jgi:single-strand DNA-binding protein
MSLYVNGLVRIITKPQTRYLESGNSVVNFVGGIHEGKDKNGNYIKNVIDCEVWGKVGEIILERCNLMDSIMVTGSIRRQEWQDKETGAKRSKHVLSIGRFEFLPRNTSDDAPARQSPADDIDDDSIPF